MAYTIEFTTKEVQRVRVSTTILKTFLWVCLLWLWATVLENTNSTLDLVILLISAPPALFLFWVRPEYGIIALMFFAHGFLEPDIVDVRLPLFGGLELRDILMIGLFLLGLFRALGRKEFRVPWWPVGGLLLAFFAMMMFSLLYALFFEGVAGNWAMSDARILFFYSVYFTTAWTITNKKALYIVVIGSFVIADMTAAIVLIQQRMGPYNYFLNSMHDSSWQIWEVAGATRVVPPGIVFMYFMMLVSLGLTIFWRVNLKTTIFWVLHTGFLGIGLLFTFTRSAWVASAISLFMMAVLLFPVYRRYFLRLAVLGIALLLFLVGTLGIIIDRFDRLSLQNAAMLGIFDRFTSIFTVEDTLETNSLQWRYFEIQEATKAINESPWLGVGLGNTYRDVTAFQGEAQGLWSDEILHKIYLERFPRYVHSSYYAIAVKMGIPGLIILLSFCFAGIFKSITLHYRLPNGMAKGLALAVGCGMVGLLQWSFLHANLMLATSTTVIGMLFGLLATVHYLYISQPYELRRTSP